MQGRWIYQLSVLRDALNRLNELHDEWQATRDTLPIAAQPGTPVYEDALAEYHAESWSCLDDWSTHGRVISEVNTAARGIRSPLAPTPSPAPARHTAARK
ncbi:hypothetical protein ACFXA0_24145 [Streptomyces cyaneofuscatus]|uniref:hypothetical protein n=1 Tax=Streptomyces cyaneofuscatus TaxID=66883 RepID=UPI00369005EC